ncbi:MAG: hypothetical protein MJA30_07280 [Cytophagales bacterium]|nr:hypothetical protein [Cytophagales bacterium]
MITEKSKKPTNEFYNKMKQNLIFHITLFTLVTLIWGCGDEVENLIERKGETVLDTLSTRPIARILTYSIENSPTDIYSAINDSTRQIIVYLPHYYALEFIDPVISMPSGASISPGDDELVPVFSEEPFVYTVSAPGEDDVKYTIIPIVQQPRLILDEFSTEEDTTVILISRTIEVTGENFIPEVTTVYLIDEEENEWPLSVTSVSRHKSNSMLFLRLDLTYEENIDTFLNRPFWFEMRAYALTARMQYPVRMRRP